MVCMEKIWYIEIEGKQEGPYNLLELKRDIRLSPDTLVWKKGFEKWIPIRDVPELKEVFKDEPNQQEPNEEKPTSKQKSLPLQDELTLPFEENFPYFFLWLIIALVILSYLLYKIYGVK